ncbi:hypothetical protein M0804_005600 [Polistes exclamans]|nr:hypothetical protein M0804_005600 [Polistes exclamans]
MIEWMNSRICTVSPSCHFGAGCKLVLSRSLNLSLKLTRLRECLVNISPLRPQAFSFALQSVSKRTYLIPEQILGHSIRLQNHNSYYTQGIPFIRLIGLLHPLAQNVHFAELALTLKVRERKLERAVGCPLEYDAVKGIYYNLGVRTTNRHIPNAIMGNVVQSFAMRSKQRKLHVQST